MSGSPPEPTSTSTFTFAVIGHDERDTLALPVGLALGAAEPGDRVLFVDSASTDGSAAVAAALGAEVLEAPLGKGRAMARALEVTETDYVCFLDADARSFEQDVATRLRTVVGATGAEMVVAGFHEPGRRRAVTPAIYRPLRAALFGELPGGDAPSPLSGFRAVRRAGAPLPFPPGYGVETHLELELALAGSRIERCDVGTFTGKLRNHANVAAIGADVAVALLDGAVAHGRLTPGERPAWEAWVAPVLEHLRRQPPDGDAAAITAHVEALRVLAARPMPDRSAQASTAVASSSADSG